MLTTALLRARVVKHAVVAQYVDPDKPSTVDAAEGVLERVHAAVEAGESRGELEQAIAEMCSERADHKIVRGLAKIATDRTDFATDPPVDPVAFRREVFLAARATGPLALSRGPLERPVASDVLATVAARHGLDAGAARAALYADLRENQEVLACRVPSARWLIDRYNVALAQAVLYTATEVRIRLAHPEAPRMRQLLRWVRFHQLIATSERDGDDLLVTLDGPQSLFKQSARYGTQLARFLPWLLLQDGEWSLEATVLWTKARHRKTFSLTPAAGLVSHVADTGAYRTEAQQHFEARFRELDTAWTLEDGDAIIPLGPKRVVFPDYVLRKGRRKAYLQWVGFWRKETFASHLADVQRYGPKSLVLAVSKRLAADKDLAELSERCIVYTGALSPRKVVDAIEK